MLLDGDLEKVALVGKWFGVNGRSVADRVVEVSLNKTEA